MESASILSRLETEPPRPVQPLFNRMLSYQRRNLRARQLGLGFRLPKLAPRSESPTVRLPCEQLYRKRRSPRRNTSLVQKPLCCSSERTHARPLRTYTKSPLVRVCRSPTTPVSVSQDREQTKSVLSTRTEEACCVSPSAARKSVHYLDLKMQFPGVRILTSRGYRPFRIRIKPSSIKPRVSSIPDVCNFPIAESPQSSRPSTVYSLARYSTEPAPRRRILLQKIRNADCSGPVLA